MPQTELKVVRCPNCNTAYNAAAVPPGKGFRCKKCSTVVGGSAPAAASEHASPSKRPSTQNARKPAGATSRRVKPEGRTPERAEGRGTGRARAGAPQPKNPMIWIVGGVLGVAILALLIAKMGGSDDAKPAPKKVEEQPKAEQPKAETAHVPDALDNDTTGHLTDFAKQRAKGFNGQDKGKIDPLTGAGTTDTPPPDPNAQEPPKDPAAGDPPKDPAAGDPPKDHDPLDDEKPPEHKD